MKHWHLKHKISHEEYQTIINEEEKYKKIKEDIRIIKIQRSDELNQKEKKKWDHKMNKLIKYIHF